MTRTFIFLLFFLILDSLHSFAQDTSHANDKGQYFDSAYFSIIRRTYITGDRFLECYQNKLTKLDSTREYYQNGKLKEEGIMTSGNHIYVGVWKYYSQSGRLNKVVNYDNKQPISYFKALKIAETKGFKMPDLEVGETVYKNNKSWEVSQWTEKLDHSGQIAEIILINKTTGEIVKPKYRLESVY